ncbi:MAG: hypothetical protein P9L90_05400 [Candidatus Aadella gelida]|nr:hypothetical protein [Candidatus Aadella gelida]
MNKETASLPELEKLLTGGETTKKDLDDLAWFIEHHEYEHRVVDVRTFIDSPEYLNAEKECWSSIKDDLEELFAGDYTEAVFCEGIGAGKSFKSSIIMAYLVYKTLCLRNPQDVLGLAKDSQICFINMSVRADQSKRVVFNEIKGRIDNSPWFRTKYPPDSNIKSELRFPKGVTVFPGNSRETFPLGLNILGGVMDEAAWYTETKDHDVAEEIFNALHNRIKNRFGDRGLLVIISSPRYVDDFIEKKMSEADTNPMIFARRKMLWDSKPASCFSGEWIDLDEYRIPKDFEIEAKRNPEVFKRDYMAIPSLALEPFFKQFSLIEKCITEEIKHPIDENGNFYDWFKGKRHTSYHIHVDLSLKRDATGVAMAHNEEDMLVVDLMLQIKPPLGGEIRFADIRNMIIEIKNRGFRLRKVTYDGWQSVDSIQILRENHIYSETLSVDRDTCAYDTLKEKIYEEKIKYYRYEPFLKEVRRLELKEGKKVDHPPVTGSKDVTDAVAGAVLMAAKAVGRKATVSFF